MRRRSFGRGSSPRRAARPCPRRAANRDTGRRCARPSLKVQGGKPPSTPAQGWRAVTQRRFRFGLLAGRAASLGEWRELARKAEAQGYSTLLVPDHFGRQLAPFAALMAAAAVTTELRLGTFVIDNDFRHPAALAKEAATVDLLTDGRLELGIGAGWNPADYRKTGISFEPAGTRVAKLEEALHIVKAFFEGGSVSFRGRYYTIDGLEALP